MPDLTAPSLAELIELRRHVQPAPSDAARATLAERFLLPPFSVLDARQGYWQTRKRMWLALGIQSELGRGDNLGDVSASVAGITDPAEIERWNEARRKAGQDRRAGAQKIRGAIDVSDMVLRTAGSFNNHPAHMQRLGKAFNIGMQASKENDWETQDNQGSGTSIFDPVLCEIAYRWFCPAAGRVLDPFAGGSVRGIVAAKTGRSYAGMDLRQEQCDANYAQAEWLCPDADLTWVCGDASNIKTELPGAYDLVFSCPPYADLERYSNDPRDLSTMEYPAFMDCYHAIIHQSCAMLKEDRFAVFVVGDVRNRVTGNYRNFVGDTVAAFRCAGLELYNEAVLVTSVGSLPIRVGRQFATYRKLGKTHQNMLVFLKGDCGRASQACGDVDVDDLTMPAYVEGGIAVCRADAVGTILEPWLLSPVGDEADVGHVYLPPTESYLACDIARGQARMGGKYAMRVWIGTDGMWSRVDDATELTYVIGSTVYLNRAVFPNAALPVAAPPVARSLRGL